MNISGGGLDNTFKKILSTFKFLEVLETGPGTYCKSDNDCWCIEFTGAEFIEGSKVGGKCDPQKNRCEQCIYY